MEDEQEKDRDRRTTIGKLGDLRYNHFLVLLSLRSQTTIEKMLERSPIHNSVIDRATDKNPINELGHLHCKQRYGVIVVIKCLVQGEEGFHDLRHIDWVDNVRNLYIRGRMDELCTSIITIY
ncbi:hypothetical protein AAC387_Pa04g1013 [Persea americana]